MTRTRLLLWLQTVAKVAREASDAALRLAQAHPGEVFAMARAFERAASQLSGLLVHGPRELPSDYWLARMQREFVRSASLMGEGTETGEVNYDAVAVSLTTAADCATLAADALAGAN